jgi:hypothetical protein
MRPQLPEPLRLPWELKENLTAKSGVDELADGRTKYWAEEYLGRKPEYYTSRPGTLLESGQCARRSFRQSPMAWARP